jgi:hypothetical protein
MKPPIFLTKVRTAAGKQPARLLIESLRHFGGDLSESPFWLFAPPPQAASMQDLTDLGVRIVALDVPEQMLHYPLADKVYACARAEELAPPGVQSLVWMDLSCLVVNPPELYDLGGTRDAALRPVHIRNVGLPVAGPLDAYWKKIYETLGIADIEITVESFVDKQSIRAYYNTHAFAINPAKGLLRSWLAYFDRLLCNQDFQAGPCQDELHQVFLHQAVFSALLASTLAPERVRMLPPAYNYPYNLHSELPLERQAQALNDLVTLTYEDRSLNPADVRDIEIREPLRSWLAGHAK